MVSTFGLLWLSLLRDAMPLFVPLKPVQHPALKGKYYELTVALSIEKFHAIVCLFTVSTRSKLQREIAFGLLLLTCSFS